MSGEVALARPKLEQRVPLARDLLLVTMILILARAFVRRLTS